LRNAALSVRGYAVVLSFVVAAFAVPASAEAVAAHAKPNGGGSTTASCTLTSAGVGQPLLLSGSGFAPDSQYVLFLTSPAGTGATTVNTDSSGSLTYDTFASWPGVYSAQIMTESHHSTVAASCSTTV
jgi:hypothetical protein